MKKLVSLVLALCLVLASCVVAFAAPTAFTTGSITVKNATKGETYYCIKALGAIVSEDGITYDTNLPDDLDDVFEVATKTVNGVDYQTVQKKDGVTDAQVQDAMRAYANTVGQANWGTGVVCAENEVKFSNLEPGYYVIISTFRNVQQGETVLTNKVSAGSTYNGDEVTPHTADGIVYEKNDTEVVVVKEADGTSYSIGDTITYTVSFPTKNYMGSGKTAQIIIKYQVTDTLPAFLSNATVTQIKVGDTVLSGIDTSNFKRGGEGFFIPWADGNATDGYTSKYANGTPITITYTAVLTDVVNVNAENTNRISITPWVAPNTPWQEPWEDTDEITTYAAAVKKVDENGYPLTGATFKFAGLQTTKTADGIYTVVSTTAAAADETVMEVGPDGILYIVGLKAGLKLTGTEVQAPAGYNLMTSTFEVEAQVLSKEVYKANGTRYYDADGNLLKEDETSSISKTVDKNLSDLNTNAVQVVNNKGTELPSTGGIGTTIFYILGGLLVVGAAVILVARRRVKE